jgi:glycosyltransferase involved in cell wall biosynthesis
VSVVIPTYNGSALLMQTLETVFAQTMGDFELVVVDDGSTDDTRERLAGLSDPRLRIVTQQNRGIGAARNRCLEEARAPFISLLDHDDLWHPEKLRFQTEFLEGHPECVAVTVPCVYSDRPDVPVFDAKLVSSGTHFIERPLYWIAQGQLVVMSSSLMLSRTKIGSIRYPSIPGTMEDAPFYLRLFSRGKLGLAANQPLMTYRHHHTNASHQAAYFQRGIEFLRKLEEQGGLFEQEEHSRNDGQAYVASIGRTAAMRLLAAGELRSSAQVYVREWRKQAELGRLKFLMGFPLAWTARAIFATKVDVGCGART